MHLIQVFGKHIKPHRMKGIGLANPTETSQLTERLYAVREWDVNFWLYDTGDGFVAFDAGYKDYPRVKSALKRLGLREDRVRMVFLTHADMDHGGGVADEGIRLFPEADVFLHEREEKMLLGIENRFRCGPIGLKNPVRRRDHYRLLKDGETMRLGDATIEILATPGHTPGHSCYLLDKKYLFTGDCLAVNQKGGFGFFSFFNMNTKQNLSSIQALKSSVDTLPLDFICTGHSGFYRDPDFVFSQIEEVARASRKNPFDTTAPYDVFKENE